jgi:hypothetical protein
MMSGSYYPINNSETTAADFFRETLRDSVQVEMAKRAGPGPVKPGQNRAGPAEPAGLSFCPSPARSGPKRAGPARLAQKNGPKSGLNGPLSTF